MGLYTLYWLLAVTPVVYIYVGAHLVKDSLHAFGIPLNLTGLGNDDSHDVYISLSLPLRVP